MRLKKGFFLFQTLGKFMCGFTPMVNTLAVMASSLCLAIIALDRYQNVVSALSTKWDPSPLNCIGIASALFFFCCGKLYEYNFITRLVHTKSY